MIRASRRGSATDAIVGQTELLAAAGSRMARVHAHIAGGGLSDTTQCAVVPALSSNPCGADHVDASSQLDLDIGRRITVDDVIHGAQFAAPGDTYGALTTQQQASATVHACLAAGIRWFDTAPLYTDSEDKLGRALMTATSGTCGGAVVEHLSDRILVNGTEVHVITKTGRLIRRRTDDTLGWRPLSSGGIVPKGERTIADDFSANGAFVSYAESMERLGVPAIDTLRMHDADSCGGPGAVFFSGAIDQALDPQGMLAGLRALRDDGAIKRISLGMNAHRGHRDSLEGKGTWSPSVITDLIDAAPTDTIDTVLLAYGWNLLCHDALEVMTRCQQAGVKVHVAGTFGGDLYSIFRPVGPDQKAKVAAWQCLADEHGVSLPAVAIDFAFLPACVERVIFGMRTVEEVKQNMAAMAEEVPPKIWQEAQRRGLLPVALQL